MTISYLKPAALTVGAMLVSVLVTASAGHADGVNSVNGSTAVKGHDVVAYFHARTGDKGTSGAGP
jgi:hypothetical protein